MGVHFSCFMTILSHFGFIIFDMTHKLSVFNYTIHIALDYVHDNRIEYKSPSFWWPPYIEKDLFVLEKLNGT